MRLGLIQRRCGRAVCRQVQTAPTAILDVDAVLSCALRAFMEEARAALLTELYVERVVVAAVGTRAFSGSRHSRRRTILYCIAQRFAERLRACVAPIGMLLQTLADELTQLAWYEIQSDDSRLLSRRHDVQRRAECVDVAALVNVLAADKLLRRCVEHRPHE